MKARAFALLLFIAALILFTLTLQPSLAWGDGTRLQREVLTAESFILAEMVAVDFAPDPFPFARLGVAAWDHPLYVMIGHTLVQWLPALDGLWLTNWLSAVFGAAALALFFLWLQRQTGSLPGSLFAAGALAVSHTFWWHAVTPEVYTLFLLLLLLTLTLYERYERTGNRSALLLAFFTLGLGAANHLLALLIVPALLVDSRLNRTRRRQVASRSDTTPSFLLFLGAAFFLGFLPYAIQFVRLLRTFPVAQVMGPAVGSTFLRGSLAVSPASLVASTLSYLTFLTYQFTPVGVALGLYGWWAGRRYYPGLWQRALLLYLTYGLFALVYRVADQFAFFLAAHVFWAAAMGMGAARLWQKSRSSSRRLLATSLAALILMMPFIYKAAPSVLRAAGVSDETFGIPQVGTGVRDGLTYYLVPYKQGDVSAYDFGRETMSQLPPDSLILAEWYTDTDEYFVLRFFAVVEGMRPDITILGWPTVDPFAFDASLAVEAVETSLPRRPVYLASLSNDYYGAASLVARYCIVPEHNLYRVYPDDGDGRDCLETIDE